MSPIVRHTLLVVLAASTIFFTNLGGPRLWDRDEPRNAGCAAEMMQRGDWVVPVFNGELRTHKPVLLYWLMMSAYEVFGVSEFAARFWSATLSVGTVLMTYHIGRRLFDASAGLWGALSLASAFMFGIAARAATPDAVLIFCSTLAIFAYVMLISDPLARWKWSHAVLIFGAMGLGVLAKGPVGLVMPTAVIGMYLLIVRLQDSPNSLAKGEGVRRWFRWLAPFQPLHFLRTCWAMRPVTAIAVSLLVALPWYLWVHYRTEGAWTAGFFFEHNLQRATQAMEGHRGNVFYYPIALLAGFFPWSIFIAPLLLDTARQLRQRDRWTRGYVFGCCWVAVYLVIFSLARTKLANYITPCYPGIAILMGAFIARLAGQSYTLSRGWLRLAMGTSVVAGIAIIVALPIAANFLLPGEEWLGNIGLVPLTTGVIGWLWIERSSDSRLTQTYAVGGILFTTLALALVPQRVDRFQHNDQLLAAIFSQTKTPVIAHFRYLESTWTFYANQPVLDVATPEDAGSLTVSLAPVPGTRRWEPRKKMSLAEFLDQSPEHFVITTRAAWEESRAAFPAETQVLAEAPYFFKFRKQKGKISLEPEHLVVIGRRAEQPLPSVSLADRLPRLQR